MAVTDMAVYGGQSGSGHDGGVQNISGHAGGVHASGSHEILLI